MALQPWIPNLAGYKNSPDVPNPIWYENGVWTVPETFTAGNKWSKGQVNRDWAIKFGGKYTEGGVAKGMFKDPNSNMNYVFGNDPSGKKGPGTWTFKKDPTQYLSSGAGATFIPGEGQDRLRTAVKEIGPAIAVGAGGPLLGMGLNAITAGTALAPVAAGAGAGSSSLIPIAATTGSSAVGGATAGGYTGLGMAGTGTAGGAGIGAGAGGGAGVAVGAGLGGAGGGLGLVTPVAAGTVAGGLGSIVGPVAGGLIGGGLTYLGAKDASENNIEAAKIAAESARFKPYNVYSGYGSGTMSGNTATATLAPEYKSLRDQYLGIAGNTAGEINKYNPDAMAKQMYGKLQDVSAFQRQQDANAFENRLQQQGMMGLNQSGENPLMGAFQRAQQQANLQREIGAYGMSQDWADQMLRRSTGASSAATGLDALPMQNLNLGGTFGGSQAQAAQFGANQVFQANQGQNAAYANLWGNLGNTLGAGVGQYLSTANWNSPFTNQKTSPISAEQAGMLANYYGRP